MRLAVDFDHVLFDTSGFYSEIPIDADTFKDTFETVYLDNGEEYTVTGHVNELNRRGYSVTEQELETLYDKAPEYLRVDGLQRLTEVGEVVIATRASHQGWQRQKITASGAEQYVDDVIVVHGPPEEHPKTVSGADLLVDDWQHEHDHVDTDGYHFDETTDTFEDVVQQILGPDG